MATNTNATYLGSQLVLLNGLPMILASATADPGAATNGSIYYNTTSNLNRQYINGAWANIGTGTGSGTVTSVALLDGSTTPIYTISGSPVTTTGTLTFSLATQSANTVFAGATSGGAAQPAFRALVAADIPSLSATYELVSNFAVRSYNNSIALAANTVVATTLAAFTFAYATYGSIKVDYVMIEASTSSRRQGTFRVSTDGTNTGIDDSYAQSATIGNGVVLSAAVSGANVIVQFTGTNANAVTMRAEITQFAA